MRLNNKIAKFIQYKPYFEKEKYNFLAELNFFTVKIEHFSFSIFNFRTKFTSNRLLKF